jgi:prolyl oligopeptidase
MNMLTMLSFPVRSWIRGAAFSAVALAAVASAQLAKPPVAPVKPVIDTYWGHDVEDPYRWLEDQSSAESKAWMKAQADYARAVLDRLPGRKAFAAEMMRYMNAEEFTITDVQLAGEYVFYRKRKRDENIASLYVRKASGGQEKLLLDMARMGTAEHHMSLDQYTPSEDGKLVVVGVSPGGSEQQTASIYETTTGRELPEKIERYVGGGFSVDGKMLYYVQREDLGPHGNPIDKWRRPKEFAHTLGSPVNEDKVVVGQGVSAAMQIPDYTFPFAIPTPTSKRVLGFVLPGVETFREVYVADPSALTTHTGWAKVAGTADKVTDAALEGDDLYLVSFEGTPNGKLLKTSAEHPDLKTAQVVVAPSDLVFSGGLVGRDVLQQASDALYLRVIDKGYGQVLRLPYTAGAKAALMTVPQGMQVGGVATDALIPGAVLDLDSWTAPGDFYRYDTKTAALTKMDLREKNDVDPTDLVAEEVQVKSWDGTMVPLTIIYKKGLIRNGSTPTAMIGYGAYGDAFTPAFSRRYNAWLERGGVLAVTHVRGGGEFGESWHLAGKELTKPNTWRDFIASAEYLIDNQYTSSAKLGVWSQSAGGILIGRSFTERPDLFAAAVDGVPCSDMLREETGPNGPANIPEFGSVKTQAGFEDLYAMSAYYHIQKGVKYPAILMTAGANDPRVDPWQGGKMAAKLQAATGSDKPVLLRVNYDAGHGLTDTVSQQVSDWTDIFTFFLWNFGDPDFQPADIRRPDIPSM